MLCIQCTYVSICFVCSSRLTETHPKWFRHITNNNNYNNNNYNNANNSNKTISHIVMQLTLTVNPRHGKLYIHVPYISQEIPKKQQQQHKCS